MLKEVKKVSLPWVAIIDHSINIGIKKLLVVLRVEMSVLADKGKAISLEDCECIGIKICKVVNKGTVSQDLKEIFDISGVPTAIIKDTDATLNSGVKKFIEENREDIAIIDDISHVVAKSLKKEFEDTKSYKQFTKLINNGSARIRNTDIAFLTPPKLRNKARFQSISKLGKWGEKMMDTFNKRGRAKKGSILEKLRKAFPQFSKLKSFIKNFANTTSITSKIMERLKNIGLEQSTYDECKLLLKELPRSSKTAKELRVWLDKHIRIQQQLTKHPLPVSSDIIESLFGKFKHTIERSPQTEMNRSVLIIPALCGKVDESTILRALDVAKHKDLKNWEKENVGETMKSKRLSYFNNNIQKAVKN